MSLSTEVKKSVTRAILLYGESWTISNYKLIGGCTEIVPKKNTENIIDIKSVMKMLQGELVTHNRKRLHILCICHDKGE